MNADRQLGRNATQKRHIALTQGTLGLDIIDEEHAQRLPFKYDGNADERPHSQFPDEIEAPGAQILFNFPDVVHQIGSLLPKGLHGHTPGF